MCKIIENLLKEPESKTLEFKENATSLKPIIKTVVAFANTSGGIIVIGVSDKGKRIVGVENPLQEEERLANAIADSIEPLILLKICWIRTWHLCTYRFNESGGR